MTKLMDFLSLNECQAETTETQENPEIESQQEGLKKDENSQIDPLSPQGVLQIPISGPNSDHSSSSSNSSSNNLTDKSTSIQRVFSKQNSNGYRWKNMFGALKKKSAVRRFSNIPTIASAELSKRRLSRIHSTEEEVIDCDGIAVPKPSWRSFGSDELAAATENFSPENLIGKGGHAEVYKGCLPDGTLVAVKKLVNDAKELEERTSDFLSELGIIAHINHPNAAKLLGFSVDGGLHLVLEFSPHGSLASLLHVIGSENSALEWDIRFKVALEVAEGLQYLHQGCHRRIIHRDIKASNVLLTEDFSAQISDFGLAKWLPDKWAHRVIFPIEGTFGYLAPEYFMHGIVDEKTDVFAYGVLLLEIITGRHAIDSTRQSLALWAKPLLDTNQVKELADPRLGDMYDLIEMKRAMATASACIHHSLNQRPYMKSVVQLLRGEDTPTEPRKKSIGGITFMLDDCDLENYTSATYLKDLNRHMQLVME